MSFWNTGKSCWEGGEGSGVSLWSLQTSAPVRIWYTEKLRHSGEVSDWQAQLAMTALPYVLLGSSRPDVMVWLLTHSWEPDSLELSHVSVGVSMAWEAMPCPSCLLYTSDAADDYLEV